MMYKKNKIFVALALFIATSITTSCQKEEYKVYDVPFIHIHQNERSEVRVRDNRNEAVSYFVYLSAKKQFKTTIVNYEFKVGDGLVEGEDFEIITTGKELVFAPGVMEMPIEIRWLRNPIDPEKENTLIIQLLSNNRDFILGLPGPNLLQTSLTITKY